MFNVCICAHHVISVGRKRRLRNWSKIHVGECLIRSAPSWIQPSGITGYHRIGKNSNIVCWNGYRKLHCCCSLLFRILISLILKISNISGETLLKHGWGRLVQRNINYWGSVSRVTFKGFLDGLPWTNHPDYSPLWSNDTVRAKYW